MTPTLGTQAFALARQGKTWAEIAAALGVPYHTAYRAAHVKARALGVPVTLEPLRRGVRPRYPMTCALRAKGLTLPEAAARLGVTPVTLGKWATGSHRPHPRHLAALRELLGDAVDLGLSGPTVAPAEPVAPKTVSAPKPRTVTRGEYAYTERGKGRSWRDIGQALEHPWEVAIHRAHQHARDYATARGLPWPPVATPDAEPTKGQRAYEMRRAGKWWGEIGKALDMPRKGSAHDAAERYAYANHLPWPPE